MAFKKDILFEAAGVTVTAYIRVEDVRLNRFEQGMTCTARCYREAPGFPPVVPAFMDMPFVVPYDPAAGDVYEQAYAGAKALPQFEGAVDVVEPPVAP